MLCYAAITIERGITLSVRPFNPRVRGRSLIYHILPCPTIHPIAALLARYLHTLAIGICAIDISPLPYSIAITTASLKTPVYIKTRQSAPRALAPLNWTRLRSNHGRAVLRSACGLSVRVALLERRLEYSTLGRERGGCPIPST